MTKFGYQDANRVSTPNDVHVHPRVPRPDESESQLDFPYQEIVGSLMYLATYSQPDIAQAVSIVSKFSNNFREIHITIVKRILKYLRGTTNYAIQYGKTKHPNHQVTYANADYAGDLDNRKSRSGTILILNGGPILWLSRKQACTATSTTESEYVAASLAAKETVWVCRLLHDIGYPQKILLRTLFSNNQSAIRLVLKPEFHKHRKHIDVVFHLIREFQDKEEISVNNVPTKLQLDDNLTKSLTLEVQICFV